MIVFSDAKKELQMNRNHKDSSNILDVMQIMKGSQERPGHNLSTNPNYSQSDSLENSVMEQLIRSSLDRGLPMKTISRVAQEQH